MPNIDDHEITETGHKALHINLDATKYGTFAEIGAGQEVGRWFFPGRRRVGYRCQDDFGVRQERQRRHLRPRRALCQPQTPPADAGL